MGNRRELDDTPAGSTYVAYGVVMLRCTAARCTLFPFMVHVHTVEKTALVFV